MDSTDTEGVVAEDPPAEHFFAFEDTAAESHEDDWGFSSAPAPVSLVAEEDDWDFDSAPVAVEATDPIGNFKSVVHAAAIEWLGKDWRSQLDEPDEPRPASDPTDLSWRDEMVDIKWEDTETYQRYHNTLKGMLGGHRAALMASVVKRGHGEQKDEDEPVVQPLARPKRRERLQSDFADEDQTNPFT